MRRLLRWTFPLTLGIAAAILFGSGFWLALRGGAGEPVTAGETTLASPPIPSAPSQSRILIVGDSLARGTGDSSGRGVAGNLAEALEERFEEKPEVVNLAVNGARTRDLLAKLERENVRQVAASSNIIIVSIGGNDLFGLSIEPDADFSVPDGSARAAFDPVLKRVRLAVRALREANPEARIFLIGLYDPFRQRGRSVGPYVAAWNSALTEAFGDDPRVTVVQTADLFVERDRLSADRFHPGDEAYALIARRIADTL